MRWSWDARKARSNQKSHGLSFKTALRVFDDPLALSRVDDASDEERWQTVGQIENIIVFVVHTATESSDGHEESGRIISARKATAHERKAYEEGTF